MVKEHIRLSRDGDELPNASKVAQSGLNGASLPPITLLLVSCGVIGSVIFTTTYLIEGITRPGYNALQQPISALSLGPGGWVQQINFIVFGLFMLCSAIGWRLVLKPGTSSIWYPLFRGIAGLGLIFDGFFSQDPAVGYPVGALLGTPTFHGAIHTVFAFIAITTLALGCFVFARRFAREPHWRGWATYSVITGLLTIIFIAIFGVATSHAASMAGLFERMATGFDAIWGLLLVVRLLLMQRGEASNILHTDV